MKSNRLFSLLVCVAFVPCALTQAPDPAGSARKALDFFLAGKYPELNQMFAAGTKASYTPDALAKLGNEAKAWGAVQKIGQPSSNNMGLVTVVTIPVEFAQRNIDFTFPVNAEDLISQMYMRPGQTPWQRPDYVKPAAFQTREVTVGTDEWKLPGTLTLPLDKRPCPAIVLVADEGPNDRDQSVYAVKMFRDLAEGLASRGIAVLRYEKRTRYYATKLREGSYTMDDETVHDAEAALALLRTIPEIDGRRMFVLGLGTGGYIAPRIAADDGHLAGLIIVNSPSKPLEDWYVETAQAAGATGIKLETVKTQAMRVKRLDPGDADSPSLFLLPAAWWLDLKGYDAPAETKKLLMPILIVQGGRDFQVIPQEFDGWKTALSARRDVTLKQYPNLNHYLIAGEGKSSEAEYKKPNQHVAPEVIDDIIKFVQ